MLKPLIFNFPSPKHSFSLLMAAAFLCAGVLNAQNLVTNGDFAKFSDGKPADWRTPDMQNYTLSIDTKDKPADAKRSLKIHIDNTDSGLGQISQKFSVTPGAEYLLEGWVSSSGSERGLIQIKLYSGKEEIKRISARSSGGGWEKLSQAFIAEGADYAAVILRYKQSEREIGNTLNFADISVTEASSTAPQSK